jgi:uncharacterized membrane protein
MQHTAQRRTPARCSDDDRFSVESIVLFCHLLGAFLLVGGMVVTGIAFEAARRGQTPLQIATLLGLARVGALLVVVGTLLVGGFGLWLVGLGGFGYAAGWLDAALALLAVSIALGAIGGRRPKRARQLAVAEINARDASSELRRLLDDRGARTLNYLAALLIVVIIALMVFKPGAV